MRKTEMSLASNMRLLLCSSSQIESCSALSVLLSTTICITVVVKKKQCGPVVRALASRSGDPGFKTRSDHSLNLILVVPAALVDSLVCLRPAGILNRCCCCFSLANIVVDKSTDNAEPLSICFFTRIFNSKESFFFKRDQNHDTKRE